MSDSGIRYLDISNNQFLEFIGSENVVLQTRFRHLEYFDCRWNKITGFHSDFFAAGPALKTLLLGGNALGPRIATINLKNNTHLEVIDVSFNNISEVTHDFLEGLASVRQLNLSGNPISHFNLTLNNLHRLELLNLSANNIAILSRDTRLSLDELAERGTLTVDLSSNPLSCKCEDLDFIEWFQSTKVLFNNGPALSCADSFLGALFPHFADINDVRDRCFPNTAKTIALAVTMTFILTLAVSAAVPLYRKRWKIQLWWYIIRKGFRDKKSAANHFDYDAFVAYDFDDFPWVKDYLLRELEEKRGLKLCIHHRDFPGGEYLEDIIVGLIHRSRKTIFLLMPKFVQSRWCDYELSIARN
jgi:toll-like receptor 13